MDFGFKELGVRSYELTAIKIYTLMGDEQLPFIFHIQLPITNYQLPITNPQLPIPNAQSPIPTIIHNPLKPVPIAADGVLGCLSGLVVTMLLHALRINIQNY